MHVPGSLPRFLFGVVQLDAHALDALFALTFPVVYGVISSILVFWKLDRPQYKNAIDPSRAGGAGAADYAGCALNSKGK